MKYTIEEIGAKMDALNLWVKMRPFNFAIKAKGLVTPYFCTVAIDEFPPVKARLLLLEGWCTLNEFLHAHMDLNFGVYTLPIEFPHYEMVILHDGTIEFFRHDAGYVPVEVSPSQRELMAPILWEVYGVMLHFESDDKLAMKYAEKHALFGRLETEPGKWRDEAFVIPPMLPYKESITIDKREIQKAKDLPMVADYKLAVDFRMMPNRFTKEERPRCVYQLLAVDIATKAPVIDLNASVARDGGLKGLWEVMPMQLLLAMIDDGKIPSEIQVKSQRMMRFLRVLTMELPFKLVMRDQLPYV